MTTISVPLVVRRLIRGSSVTQIFSAFVSPVSLSQWFVPSPEIRVEVLAFDFVVGGRYRLRYTMPDGRIAVVSGVYEEIDEPTRIVLSWMWEAPDPLADILMRVAFAFLESEAGTEVVVTHENIPFDVACTIHQNGWEGSLDGLENWLVLQSSE